MRRRAGAASPAPPRTLVVSLLLLRLYAGAVFCDVVYYKLWGRDEGAHTFSENVRHFQEVEVPRLVRRAVEDPPEVFGSPWTGYGEFVRATAMGREGTIAILVLVAEALLAVTLLLGVGVRLGAALGALMMASFGAAKSTWLLTVQDTNWALVVILLVCSILAAGRAVGLDARLRERLPRWLRWVA